MADKQKTDPTFELFQLYQGIEREMERIDRQLWRGCRREERERLEDQRMTLNEKQQLIESALAGEDVAVWAELETIPFRASATEREKEGSHRRCSLS